MMKVIKYSGRLLNGRGGGRGRGRGQGLRRGFRGSGRRGFLG